jgi:hypothetical protein
MVLTAESPKLEKKQQGIISQRILEVFVILSLIAILAVRIYAIYNTVPIRTWDDAGYRFFALRDARDDLTIQRALDDIIFPNGGLLDHHRSIGYHSWLVFGLKLSLSGSSEQTMQLVNLILLLIQGITLFFFSRWATKNNILSGAFTSLYLASPIVFGMNRWIMTENHVMTSLMVIGFIPAWLLTCDRRPNYRKELLLGMIAAWGIGIFSGLREYAVPSYLLTGFAAIVALWWGKRIDGMRGFLGVFGIFFIFLLASWMQLYKFLAFRVTQDQYFHPMSEWLPHAILHGLGPALTILLAVGLIAVFYQLRQTIKDKNLTTLFQLETLKATVQPLHFLWLINGILVLFYIVGILASDNRPVRGVIMLMISLLNFLLISIRLMPKIQSSLKSQWVNLFMIALLVVSGTVLYHQLFIAFDGGESYAHTAHGLEFYNHPLHLRELKSAEDMHVE